jgi:hypothetical protein
MRIGNLEIAIHEKCPDDWSMENDSFREIKEIERGLYRAETWMGRVAYIILDLNDRATMISRGHAELIANAILANKL